MTGSIPLLLLLGSLGLLTVGLILRLPAPAAFVLAALPAVISAAERMPLERLIYFMNPSMGALAMVALLLLTGRLLVPRLEALRAQGGLLGFMPVFGGTAGLLQLDDAPPNRPTAPGQSFGSSLSVLSPFSLPLLSAAFLLNLPVSHAVIYLLLPAVLFATLATLLQPQRLQLAGLLPLDLLSLAILPLALLIIWNGIGTVHEALSLAFLGLLAVSLALDGTEELGRHLRLGLQDVARGALVILAATLLMTLNSRFIGPVILDLDPILVIAGLSLLTFCLGALGGCFVGLFGGIVAFRVLQGSLFLWSLEQLLLSLLLSAEAGRFLACHWRAGFEIAHFVWLASLVALAALVLTGDDWLYLFLPGL